MEQYIIFWSITAILGWNGIRVVAEKERKGIAFSKGLFPCIFLFVIAGTRSISVGNDTDTYSYYFMRMTWDKVKAFSNSDYWIYNLFVFLIRSCTSNVYIFNVCCSAVIFISLYIFIHNFSKDEQLSILLFFSLGYFFNAMNQTRQTMAIAILLLGFYFVMKKKVIPSVGICLVASLIHNVAVVMAPVYIFLALVPKISRKFVWFFSTVFIGIALIYDRFIIAFVYIFPRYRAYLKVAKLFQQKRSIYRYMDVLFALIIQIVLIYIIIKKDKEEHDEMACILACMNSICLCMAYLVTNAEVFVRVRCMFGYWMIISIPHILVKYFGNRKYLKVLVAIVSLVYLFRLGVKDGDGVIPYSFFWQR